MQPFLVFTLQEVAMMGVTNNWQNEQSHVHMRYRYRKIALGHNGRQYCRAAVPGDMRPQWNCTHKPPWTPEAFPVERDNDLLLTWLLSRCSPMMLCSPWSLEAGSGVLPFKTVCWGSDDSRMWDCWPKLQWEVHLNYKEDSLAHAQGKHRWVLYSDSRSRSHIFSRSCLRCCVWCWAGDE